ncbi:hypothetical protein SteCoe_15158 [Stentor coeruleus]|uniref:Uncharacterized protein n=1 Tax=Stentor coeruleus TaxID=5963 RepID=A0A1R2C4J6_9CILI|nr:hypothetical protein SteCoe_15158 [Stentor coeruleus]
MSSVDSRLDVCNKGVLCASSILCSTLIICLSQTNEMFQFIPTILIINLYLIGAMFYEAFQDQIRNSVCFKRLLFPFIYNEMYGFKYFSIKPFVVVCVTVSGLCALMLVIFGNTTWVIVSILGIIPLIYLTQLLLFYETSYKQKQRKVLTLVFSLTISLSILIVLNMSGNKLEHSYKIEGSVAMLAILAVLLVPSVNFMIYRYKPIAIFSSIISIIIISSMAISFMQGLIQDDISLLHYSRYLAIGVPIVYTFTDIYPKINLEPNIKTTIFVILWSFIYAAAMSMSRNVYIAGAVAAGDMANFGILAIGVYCIIYDTICRILQVVNVEIINFLFVTFFGIPTLIFAPLYKMDSLSLGGLLGLLFTFYILGFFAFVSYFCGMAFLRFIKCTNTVYCPVLEEYTELTWKNTAAKCLSVMWKIEYMVGIFILTRAVYFSSYPLSSENHWILAQVLIVTIIAMLHTCFIENYTFYVEEENHINPSLRRIALVRQVRSSVLQDKFLRLRRVVQFFMLIVWAVTEVISFLCFIKNFYMAPIIVASFCTCLLFIVVIEIKLRVWDKEEEVQQYFCIFIWSCLYLPFVCGFPVIYCSETGFSDDEGASLLIFFVVFIVCAMLGFFPSMVYQRSSNFSRLHTKNYLKKLKVESNDNLELIIEEIDKNIGILSLNNGVPTVDFNSHEATICSVCNSCETHPQVENPFKETNKKFFKFLIFDPSYQPPVVIKWPDIVVMEKMAQKNDPVPIPKYDLKDVRSEYQKYRDRFKLEPGSNKITSTKLIATIEKVYPNYPKNDLRVFLIEIYKSVKGQYQQEFTEDFIDRMLSLLAIKRYKKSTPENKKKVRDDIFRPPPVVEKPIPRAEPVKKEAPIKKAEIKKSISPTSDSIISQCVHIDNILERFVPYTLLSLPARITPPKPLVEENFSANEELRSKSLLITSPEKPNLIQQETQKLEEYREVLQELLAENETPVGAKDKVENTFLVVTTLLTGSVCNVYSLSSLALTKSINWLDSEISFAAGIIPSDKNWIVGQIYTFTLVGIFFLFSVVFYITSKKESNMNNVRKIGAAFMKFVINATVIENFVGILGNLACETSLVGESVVLNNDSLKCFSGEHIGIFIMSIVVFFAYFLFAILFYPCLYKFANETESFFNIEVLGKLMYACVVVFISDKYMNFKLLFVVLLIICSLSLSIFGYLEGKYNSDLLYTHIKENVVLLWIYFWAVLSYNDLAESAGFWILVITVLLVTVINYYESCHEAIVRCCTRFREWLAQDSNRTHLTNSTTPQIEQLSVLSNQNDSKIFTPVSNIKAGVKPQIRPGSKKLDNTALGK